MPMVRLRSATRMRVRTGGLAPAGFLHKGKGHPFVTPISAQEQCILAISVHPKCNDCRMQVGAVVPTKRHCRNRQASTPVLQGNAKQGKGFLKNTLIPSRAFCAEKNCSGKGAFIFTFCKNVSTEGGSAHDIFVQMCPTE